MILVLRALGLGDLLTAVPALRALRREFAGEEIALAAPAGLAPLVARIKAVDRLLPVPAAVGAPPGRLDTGAAPRLAVNLHGRGPQSTAALRALRPARLWSFEIPGGPSWLAGGTDEHEVRRWCRLLRHYGCPADAEDLWLTQPGPRTGPIVLHPGASCAQRRWPAGRFVAVGRYATGTGHRVCVSAGPGEEAAAVRIAARIPGATVRAGLGLDELADLIWRSPLVVSTDTGVAHLATAVQTPSVVLFGPQPPQRWGPPPLPRHRALWRPDPDGAPPPTREQTHPSLLRIRPGEVIEAMAHLLPVSRLSPPADHDPGTMIDGSLWR